MKKRVPTAAYAFYAGSMLAGIGALALLCCAANAASAAKNGSASPLDLNGTWAGPTPSFTDDGIPEPAITRDVPWAPFSAGRPENRKAPTPEQQVKFRDEMMKKFREISNSGKNVFAPGGPVQNLFGGGGPNLVLTEAGTAAVQAAKAADVSSRIPLSDVNSLLHCYPQNHSGIVSPVTIVQGPKAIVLYSGNVTRLVYLDGRTFDTAPLADYAGYSIGHWEGHVLVVETRNYRGPTLQLMPLGSFPVKADTKMTEYITKIEGGKTLQVRTVLEDSTFMKEPIGKMEYLSWAPDDVPVNEDCVEGLVGQIDYDPSKFKAQ
jgi:hypothetical protein